MQLDEVCQYAMRIADSGRASLVPRALSTILASHTSPRMQNASTSDSIRTNSIKLEQLSEVVPKTTGSAV